MKDSAQLSPEQAFTKLNVNHTFENSVPFECPMYVLAHPMQDGGNQHKWKERSRIGIYLDRSPDHEINVALVLDRTTGFVSPQYHVQFDRKFYTVQEKSRGNLDLNWQVKAGFFRKVTPPTRPAESDQLTERSHKRARLTSSDGPQQPKTSMQQLAPVKGVSSSTTYGPQKSIGLERHPNLVHFSE